MRKLLTLYNYLCGTLKNSIFGYFAGFEGAADFAFAGGFVNQQDQKPLLELFKGGKPKPPPPIPAPPAPAPIYIPPAPPVPPPPAPPPSPAAGQTNDEVQAQARDKAKNKKKGFGYKATLLNTESPTENKATKGSLLGNNY